MAFCVVWIAVAAQCLLPHAPHFTHQIISTNITQTHNRKHSGGRALSVLRKMKPPYQNHRTTLRLDSSCYTQILRILSRSYPRRQPPPGPAFDALLTSMNDNAFFFRQRRPFLRDPNVMQPCRGGSMRCGVSSSETPRSSEEQSEVWYAKEERKRKAVLQNGRKRY